MERDCARNVRRAALVMALRNILGILGFCLLLGHGSAEATAPPVAHLTSDNDIEELQRSRAVMVQQAEALNRMNPLSQAQAPAAGTGSLSGLPPQLQWIAAIGEDPRVQGLIAAIRSPEVSQAMGEMAANPHQRYALAAEVLFLLVMFFMRWRWLAKSKSFFSKVGVKLVSFGLTTAGIGVIAYVTYGQPLVTVVSRFARAF